jgi:hypothetical protein
MEGYFKYIQQIAIRFPQLWSVSPLTTTRTGSNNLERSHFSCLVSSAQVMIISSVVLLFPVLCTVVNFRKVTAIILLAVYMPAMAGICELLKLPLLAEHYFDHNEDGKHTGFAAYLMQHYITEDGTDNDAAEDSRLPFKSAVNAAGISFIATGPPAQQKLEKPLMLITSAKRIPKETSLLSQYINAIWQPPRYC